MRFSSVASTIGEPGRMVANTGGKVQATTNRVTDIVPATTRSGQWSGRWYGARTKSNSSLKALAGCGKRRTPCLRNEAKVFVPFDSSTLFFDLEDLGKDPRLIEAVESCIR